MLGKQLGKFLNLVIGKKIKMKYGSTIVTEDAQGVETTIDLTELSKLDGLTATYLEINKLTGTTFIATEANTLADLPASVTGSVVSTGGSALVSLTFLNAASTALSHRLAGKAFISSAATGQVFTPVSGVSGASTGTIYTAGSAAFDFVTTVSGRLGVNVINGSSTNYISFRAPNGTLYVSPAVTTS